MYATAETSHRPHIACFAPQCAYCGTWDGLRVKSDGGKAAFGFCIKFPEYTCEACFTGTDDGPSFDDLPEA